MTKRMLWGSGISLLAAAVLIGLLVVTLAGQNVVGVDVAWHTLMAQVRHPWMVDIAYGLHWIGGGWRAILLVPLVFLAVLCAVRRWRAAVFAGAAFAVSAGITQALKHLFGRARPDDMIVASDFGSFPSGHTANAATIAVVLWLILPRVWVALVGAGWVLAMALSRAMLAVHWGTDTLGGALVGASAALLVAAVLSGWASLGWERSLSTSRSSHAADPPLS